MNFKAFLLLSTSVFAALRSGKQNRNAVGMLLESLRDSIVNISATENIQRINCIAAKEIIIMADLSGVGDSGWANYVIPSVQKLVRSFDISSSAARVEIFSRPSVTYSFWCINVGLGS
ncbi:MAG: hypothetical protein Q8K92_13655, partial [Leadbetterella sp.]|nr:hypothetical protein [Leadbetterella sp.]